MLAELYMRLEQDPWRTKHGFAPDMAEAIRRLLESSSDEQRAAVLGPWLEKYQPCLFGRIAARKGLLSYCFLTEQDLLSSDLIIRTKIQEARTHWTRLAYEGKRSGFILLATSERLVNALPDENLLAFTKALASLFLLEDVAEDQIYLDEIFLEMPAPSRMTWRWNVGVNYFGSAGDKRWWQDHRIPGGIGFSTNSVGHLAKAGMIAEKVNELQQLVAESSDELVATKINSLPTALEWAMRTIHNASESPSGKATELLPLSSSSTSMACPIKLPTFLQDRNHCTYRGWYHTDVTVPSEYFRTDAERPAGVVSHELDFTYLFDTDLSNPDYITTATGRRIRSVEDDNLLAPGRSSRSVPTAVAIAKVQRLVEALGRSDSKDPLHPPC
jgi:hypothetical protein